jgi:probable HAF family extracellular repeat protein
MMATHLRTAAGRAVLVLIPLLNAAVHALGASGDIYHLGTFGGPQRFGTAINNSGQVVGEAQDPTTASYAFRYEGIPGSGGVMVNLGSISAPFSINDLGQVAANSGVAKNSAQAARYTGTPGNGGFLDLLGTLGGTQSLAYGINNAGQVAGVADTSGNVAGHAFLFTGTPGTGGVMADLGTLGGTHSVGIAINRAGQVTGGAMLTGDASGHAFRYSGTPGSGGMMVDLGTLGGPNSGGNAINDAGQVAGTSDTENEHEYRAFLYTGTPGTGGEMVDLGTLGTGDVSEAFGINSAGFVVGYSRREIAGPNAGLFFPTLWLNDAAHTAIDLDAWLNATNPTQGPLWFLGSQTTGNIDINDNGLITGTGAFAGAGGFRRAFILDASGLVPEPASLPLLIAGALALRRCRSRDKTGRRSVAGRGIDRDSHVIHGLRQDMRVLGYASEEKFNWCPLLSARLAALALGVSELRHSTQSRVQI